jgi:VCBS repeat-containing protein
VLDVTINGANDAPVATDNSYNFLEDDADPSTGNVVTDDTGDGVDSDVDSGTVLGVGAINGNAANVGTAINFTGDLAGADVTVEANGDFRVNLNGAFDSLAEGETLSETFTYTVTEFVSTTTTILSESFESPIVSGSTDNNPDGWFDEGHPNTSGFINEDSGLFTTPFGEQAAKAWQGNQSGAQKILGVVEDKEYSVSFNVAKRDNRAQGDYRVELVSVDGGTVTILASNEGVVTTNDMSHTDSFTFSPGSSSAELGKELRIRLVDPASGQVTSEWGDGPYYDNVVVTTTSIEVASNPLTDTATVTVTVTGQNDEPVAIDNSYTVLEDATDPSTGNVISDDTGEGIDSDVDNGATLSVFDVNGDPGNVGSAVNFTGDLAGADVTVDANGDFELNLNGAFESLAAGETVTDSFTYTVTDGNVETTTILSESFESPNISGSTDNNPDGWFDEGHPNTSGIANEDNGQFTTPYGEQAAKAWQGNQSGAQKVLGSVENATYTVSFNVAKRDNRTQGDYRVELVAVDGGTVSVLASKEGIVTTNDMSHSDTFQFTSSSTHPDLGKELRIRLVDPAAGQVTGAWQDGPYYDNVVVTTSTPATSTATVTVTVLGTNDAPTIVTGETDAEGAVKEDDSEPTLTDNGTITFDDVDLTDQHTAEVTADAGNTLGGTLTLGAISESPTNSEGTLDWKYDVANSATQDLAEGQEVTETFTVSITDEEPALIYDGFDYAQGGINGENGGIGFDGAWVANRNNPVVENEDKEFGELPTTGGHVRGPAWAAMSRRWDRPSVMWGSWMTDRRCGSAW